MLLPDAGIDAIEANADRNRTALAASVAEITTRLKPAHLVDAAVEKVGKKTSGMADDVMGAAKSNGGKAALLGAGVLLAFDIGRRTTKSADLPFGEKESSPSRTFAETPREASDKPRSTTNTFGSVNNLSDVVRYWGGGLAAVMFGYVASGLVPVSPTERRLFGDVPKEAKALVEAFRHEHVDGAKQLAAQSFGIAGLAAAALSIMAVLARVASNEPAQDTGQEPSEF